MRRMLRRLKWLGLVLSTILFVGTGVLWVRSVGHNERWGSSGFEANPQWKTGILAGCGTRHWRYIEVTHGRLWMGMGTEAPAQKGKTGRWYWRRALAADEAEEEFTKHFKLDESLFFSSVNQRAWHFAGAGFNYGRMDDPKIPGPAYESRTLAIPFWMLASIFGLWPGIVVGRRVLRRRRYRAGLCPSCGYDLRATPDRCPECGRVTSRS